MNRFDWERIAYAQPFNGEAGRVLWCYASHADAETLITFPSIRQVAEETSVSVEKVGKYRRALLDTGWLAESDELTSRGNRKLVLAVGEDVEEMSYIGEKRAMSPKSMSNLVPAAKQKKDAQSLDTPDEAGLGYRGRAGLGYREIPGLDTPDVTTRELNNQDRTTNNNHAADAALLDEDLEVRAGMEPSLIDETDTARLANEGRRNAAWSEEEHVAQRNKLLKKELEKVS